MLHAKREMAQNTVTSRPTCILLRQLQKLIMFLPVDLNAVAIILFIHLSKETSMNVG